MEKVQKDKIDFLNQLKSVLLYHKEIGVDNYPKDEHVASFLELDLGANVPTVKEVAAQAKVPRPGHQVAPPKSMVKLSDIADEVAACHACELHKDRIYPVAGRGKEKVRLMIVGDWLAEGEDKLPPGQIFGVAQEQMLNRMLVAINLPPEDVFITNVIKCAIPESCQPQANHVLSCISFLRRQIAVLNPEVICTMGMIAARAVLNRPHSLSQLREKFHDYVVQDGWSVPVLATYHPTYLLRNPEMKVATWTDLKALAKRLGVKPVTR
jgi:uracil-DNA glycosylase family 4